MTGMNRSDLQSWLDRYIEAWRSNDSGQVGALFSDDAIYRWNPYSAEDKVLHGRERIVEGWLDEPDEPGSWEADYEAYAVDGPRAVAIGTSRYAATDTEPEKTYHNVFLLEFAPDGRCSAFTEYFMLQPAG
jgi:ketosteroid isomerase-like protein